MIPASFFRQVSGLLRLRIGPQDLPYSVPLLYRVAAVALLVDVIAAQVLESSGLPLPRLVAAFAANLWLPWLVLRWRGRAPRYVQTMLALLGTGIVLSLLFLPFAKWALSHGLVSSGGPPTAQQGLLAWLILGMVIWKIAVTASIWRHALDVRLAAGTGIAIAVFILQFVIDQLLFAGGAS